MALFKLTLKELQEKFTSGEISAGEIARAYLLRINQVEPKIKAYISEILLLYFLILYELDVSPLR